MMKCVATVSTASPLAGNTERMIRLCSGRDSCRLPPTLLLRVGLAYDGAMKRYPRSFLQLVTLGHVLVALPLFVVTFYVFIALETLDRQFRDAVRHGATASQLSGELREDLLHMERSLRRHEVLKDADSLNDYAQVRSEWRANVEAFAQLAPLPAPLVNELKSQLVLEDQAFAVLRDNGQTPVLHSAIEAIKSRMAKALDEAHGVIDQEQESFIRESDTLRQRLLLAAITAVVLAIGFLWLIRQLLARLIGRFERAVLRLGKGDMQQPIALDGPGDLRWLGRWLEWLRRRLLSLEESRAQVLRHVSHELKTPLAAMHEGTSLLAEEVSGTLTPEQSRIVGILQSNSRRLQNLIEGLLRLQEAGHAAERLGYEKIRFDTLINQVLETFRLIAGERHVVFECDLEETEIIAGQEALLTIVNNLLSNAVKFSPSGGRVRIVLTHTDQEAVLDVLDKGTGVDLQDATQIFEPFYRSSVSRMVAGVGLGLAIAREFVLAHQGELKLMPSKEGAHFRVTLPLDAPYLREPQRA